MAMRMAALARRGSWKQQPASSKVGLWRLSGSVRAGAPSEEAHSFIGTHAHGQTQLEWTKRNRRRGFSTTEGFVATGPAAVEGRTRTEQLGSKTLTGMAAAPSMAPCGRTAPVNEDTLAFELASVSRTALRLRKFSSGIVCAKGIAENRVACLANAQGTTTASSQTTCPWASPTAWQASP